MSKPLSVVLLGFLLSLRGLSIAAETRPSAANLLAQVQATYDKMQSYLSVGDVTEKISVPTFGPQEAHYSFSIKLARPNLYRIEWEQHAAYMTSSGTAWSAGDGNFVTVPYKTSPVKAQDMATAFSMATGVSGTAAATVPSIFFGLKGDSLRGFTDGTFGPDAEVQGDPCYVISVKTETIGETLWISKKSKLLRQERTDINGAIKIPQMTDEDVKKALQSMGQTPTAEAIKQMKAQMAAMRAVTSGATGFFIQTQRQIVLNASLHKADFTPPTVPASK